MKIKSEQRIVGNRLIAEFVDAIKKYPKEVGSSDCFTDATWLDYLVERKGLDYSNSFGEILPVVKKIACLGYNVDIMCNLRRINIYRNDDGLMFQNSRPIGIEIRGNKSNLEDLTDEECIWLGVVNFLMVLKKWREIEGRITPKIILGIPDNGIFVFASNKIGRHGNGGALQAKEKYGAKIGEPEGLQGRSYAIPTKPEDLLDRLSLNEIQGYVNNFIQFVKENPQFNYHVTNIGCGKAGYQPHEIAPFFKELIDFDNIHFSELFWEQIIKYKTL